MINNLKYVKITNLNFAMNQGDISTVFSQFGEIIDLRLARNRHHGKSMGWACIAFQDIRSNTLVCQNFDKVEICGRVIRVIELSHKGLPEDLGVQKSEQLTGPDGKGWGDSRKL